MANALKERYAISAQLIESGGGVFEIVRDGKLIYSKKATGRFPSNKEIFALLDKEMQQKR